MTRASHGARWSAIRGFLGLTLALASAQVLMPAQAMESKVNPITHYELTIFNAESDGGLFGWIQLMNGQQAAGYIYVQSAPYAPPHLSAHKTYIVMEMPYQELGNLLTILNSKRPLQITYFDPQSEGTQPSATLEIVGSTGSPLRDAVDKEQAEKIAKALKK